MNRKYKLKNIVSESLIDNYLSASVSILISMCAICLTFSVSDLTTARDLAALIFTLIFGIINLYLLVEYLMGLKLLLNEPESPEILISPTGGN